MQLVAGMMEKAHVCIPDLESVPKSHDDMFLCRANLDIGERPCVCGQRCLANFVSKIRYGPDNDKGFVCKEFLLPSQYKNFLEGNGLPPTQQKCLLCSRYWLNYTYILVSVLCVRKTTPIVHIRSLLDKPNSLLLACPPTQSYDLPSEVARSMCFTGSHGQQLQASSGHSSAAFQQLRRRVPGT